MVLEKELTALHSDPQVERGAEREERERQTDRQIKTETEPDVGC